MDSDHRSTSIFVLLKINNYLPNLGSEILTTEFHHVSGHESQTPEASCMLGRLDSELWFCKDHLPEFLGWQNEKNNVDLSSHGVPKGVSWFLSKRKLPFSGWYRRQKRQTQYRRQSIKTYHLRAGVVVCLKMVLRWSHWKNISWSDKFNRLSRTFYKTTWDLEVFSPSVEPSRSSVFHRVLYNISGAEMISKRPAISKGFPMW